MFRLMCVTAHPDDEAGSFGGSLRAYRDRGVETSVVCLTPGQAGSHRGNAKNDAELAAMRRREFMASCEILRVSRPVVLDYPDGQLYRQELNRVVYELTLQVRRFRPHVLLTFGPEGGVTGHPDHSMSGIFAGLAFHWASRANRYADQLTDRILPHRTAKLYYAAAGIAIPGRPPITFAPQTASIEIGDHLDTKIAAFKAHKTQEPLWAMFEENVRKRGTLEHFHLAASIVTGPAKPETDLFAGVAEDQQPKAS
jgi:LmbE family N-acetylglucosaminyl deacetylase